MDLLPHEITEIIISYLDSIDLDKLYPILNQNINWGIVSLYSLGFYRNFNYEGYHRHLGLTELKNILNLNYSIEELYNLKVLYVYGRLFEEIPTQIGLLNNLELLNLQNNFLKEIPAQTLLLSNLKVLNLRHNLIKKIPVEIGKLKKLIRLILNDNQIEEIPVEIGKLKKLEFLVLYNNPIKEIPAQLYHMRHKIYVTRY